MVITLSGSRRSWAQRVGIMLRLGSVHSNLSKRAAPRTIRASKDIVQICSTSCMLRRKEKGPSVQCVDVRMAAAAEQDTSARRSLLGRLFGRCRCANIYSQATIKLYHRCPSFPRQRKATHHIVVKSDHIHSEWGFM